MPVQLLDSALGTNVLQPISPGDTLVIFGVENNSVSDSPTVTDSGNNTYTLAVTNNSLVDAQSFIWTCHVTTALTPGRDTITHSISGTSLSYTFHFNSLATTSAVVETNSGTGATASAAVYEWGQQGNGIAFLATACTGGSNQTTLPTDGQGNSFIQVEGGTSGASPNIVGFWMGYLITSNDRGGFSNLTLGVAGDWSVALIALPQLASQSQGAPAPPNFNYPRFN